MRRFVLITLVWVIGAGLAVADVCPHNGNYSRSDADSKELIPQAVGFSLERQYSSLRQHAGSLGRGWASDLDRRIEIGGDGALLLFEPGRAEPMRYYPIDYSRNDLEAAAGRLLDVDYAGFPGNSRTAREQALHRLLSSPAAIDALYRQLLEQQRIAPLVIPLTTDYRYRCESFGILFRTDDGFQLERANHVDFFDRDGRLAAITDLSGQGITFLRNTVGQVVEIRSANGSRTHLGYDRQGRLNSVAFPNRVTLTYRYTVAGLLEQVLQGDEELWRYAYTVEGRLQRIYLQGELQEEIGYDAQQRVMTIQPSDDLERTYSYSQKAAPAGTETIRTDVVTMLPEGEEEPLLRTSYHYTLQPEAFGDTWISRVVTESPGYRRQVDYVGECKPGQIDLNGEISRFTYDGACRLETKETQEQIITLRYDPQWNKITQLTTTDKETGRQRWSHYEYDALGQLKIAEDSFGRRAVLDYDSLGRIVALTDENGRELTFGYNHLDKPDRIGIAGVGSIRVAYDEAGEIVNVDSDDGHKMALEVTRAFQALLSLVKPAGISLD